MLYEHRSQPLLPPAQFAWRLAANAAVGALLVAVSLAIGMTGYHTLEGLAWLDAFLNASMLLGGMGPVNAPVTDAGKLFAGLYALYCGFVVLVVAAMMLAPVVHRVLHRFHVEKD